MPPCNKMPPCDKMPLNPKVTLQHYARQYGIRYMINWNVRQSIKHVHNFLKDKTKQRDQTGIRQWDLTLMSGQIMSNAADLDLRENKGRKSLGEQTQEQIKSVVGEYVHLPPIAYWQKLAHVHIIHLYFCKNTLGVIV